MRSKKSRFSEILPPTRWPRRWRPVNVPSELRQPPLGSMRSSTRRGCALAGFGVSKPAISKHLKVLEETGVVTRVVEGRTPGSRSTPTRSTRPPRGWIANAPSGSACLMSSTIT
ncbi:MAG: ArsR/SmtB family transcription factor [Solirubrobacterales bacterium]